MLQSKGPEERSSRMVQTRSRKVVKLVLLYDELHPGS